MVLKMGSTILKHSESLIHLCWQIVEQQSIPALAIASAVTRQLVRTG